MHIIINININIIIVVIIIIISNTVGISVDRCLFVDRPDTSVSR